MSTDELYAMVRGLADHDRDAAVTQLAPLVPSNRRELEEVRTRLSATLHRHSDDYEATAALSLVNRVLATVVPTDRLDWKVRWAHGRKP